MKEFNSQSWQIEHQCPQCGAPVILEETDRILLCGYCRVRLYLACAGPFRYLIPPSATCGVSPEEVLFIPYWRYKGAVHSFHARGMEQRVVDSTLLAVKFRWFPPSLGMRPQTLKLRFAASHLTGTFLAPQFRFKMPAQKAAAVFDFPAAIETNASALFECFLGETLSIIYSPVAIRGGAFYDAVLNRSLASIPADGSSCFPRSGVGEAAARFFSTLCPACGWDLDGDKETLVLLCRNCSSAWEPSAGGLKRIDFATAGDGEASSHYLPFWKLRASTAGPVTLQSYADMVRSANLPKAVKSEWADREMSFWIPAFKVHPQLFLRLARSLTLLQPAGELTDDLPGKQVYPVTFPPSEAVESIPATVASFAVPRHLILPRIPELQVSFGSSLLVYLPFALEGEEFIHRGMQLSINRNAMKYGRLL